VQRPVPPRTLARGWFTAQAVAGALWWVLVFTSADVRRWTLGTWPPGVLVLPDLLLFVGGSAIAAWRADRRAGVVTAAWTLGVTVALGLYALATGRAGWGAVAMTVASIGSVLAAVTLWCGHVPRQWFFIGPFRFRPAAATTPKGHLWRSLRQLVVFWTGFLVVLPIVLDRIEQRWRVDAPWLQSAGVRAAGVVVFATASALGLWSCISMALRGDGTPLPAATAQRLVVAGPYRWVRNPMAVAGAVQTIGVGLWLGSWMVIVAAFAGCVVWDHFIRPDEEADLAARFGDDYARYRESVRCWLPSRRPPG